ncbi:MAG: type IX secretion system membrane protein PorP/SprF [Bacteroidia bacterium]|nr:type IX secretion system membrane protein PorP/SprF [Bacteroidales bacterium]NCD40684.1 type IX secretion system membrane protein PorP/SprF [Bacteroidia bacterium]MDD2323280.1 type IX secretion system membrane protein PorP/SprF [Bacteroidales bacterium]MDD3010405.1 type IX secretion system membrane protein PorP/SprF [Bacteroidales bacterium]MDD3961182.1 type IX secretion system membrane protein PorP/SprF [Bacteroidales bacterium]
MKKIIAIITVLIPFTLGLKAQDASFSQFYASPMFLNPALTGSTWCGRLTLNYRNQWPSISGNFVNYNAAFDQSLDRINSGYGMMFNSDNMGDGAMKTSTISGLYSYHLQVAREVYLSAGFQATYIQTKLDWNKLVFGDMIDPVSGTIGSNTLETPPANLSLGYVDFSAGAFLSFKGKFYGGFAAHHLTTPDNGFYNLTDNQLQMKLTVHGGANFIVGENAHNEPMVVSPNFLFQQQGEFHQLNMGCYVDYYPFVVGAWMRHNFENFDAAIVLVGFKHNNWKVGYSFDITMSDLSMASGGAHEISFAWEFCIERDKRRTIRTISSPAF